MTKAEIRQAIEGKVPRVHPNGFIQVDVAPSRRLHVWPDVRHWNLHHPIKNRVHSHSFALSSRVLTGHLAHIEYDVDERAPTCTIYRPSAVGMIDLVIKPTQHRVRPVEVWGVVHSRGAVYRFDAHHFHDTVVSPGTLTATLLTVTRQSYAPGCVLIPFGEAPLPRMTEALDPTALWPFIERALA